MKAEERKHLKENELAARLSRMWQTLASGSTTNTIIWGVILLVLMLAIGWRFYSGAAYQSQSARWRDLAYNAYSEDELRRIISDYPGTPTAFIARFHVARSLMQDARTKLAAPNEQTRRDAADSLEKARDEYARLAQETSDQPLLTQEALMGVARAEEILASVPKADNKEETRGSLPKAIEAYEQLASKYPTSFLGEQAAQRAKELREHRAQVEAFYAAMAVGKEHGQPDLPPLPPLPPPTDPVFPGIELPDPNKGTEVKPPELPPPPPIPPTDPPAGEW